MIHRPQPIKLEAEWQWLVTDERRKSVTLSWQFQRVTRIDGFEITGSPGEAVVTSILTHGVYEHLQRSELLRTVIARKFQCRVLEPGVVFQLELEHTFSCSGRIRPTGVQVP